MMRVFESSTFWVCAVGSGAMLYQWLTGSVTATLSDFGIAYAAVWALYRHREHYKDK